MASSLSADTRIVSRIVAPLGVVCALVALAAPCVAQVVPASEREALVRLRTERGGNAEEVDALIRVATEVAAKGLPAAALTNKIHEGLAKGVDPKRIDAVIRQMGAHLESADRLIREIEPASAGAGRDASVTLMAESFGSGVTPDQVRDLRRLAQPAAGAGKPPISGDIVASAARGLSLIEEARLPVTDGTAVMAEAVKQGFRANEILDLAREVKRREAAYRSGRASLTELRDSIARGARPDQLFRDSRTTPVERPAVARPEQPTVERPAARPEAPLRPETPVRPERPTR
jgi:hypothetical protein